MTNTKTIQELIKENKQLKKELDKFRSNFNLNPSGNTVTAPNKFIRIFKNAQKIVKKYFENLTFNPEKGMIYAGGERYVLIRASALSYDFLNTFKSLYADRGEVESLAIANNLLFDIAHLIGIEDAKSFHKKMKITDHFEKLSVGPVHFAYTGWAFVNILPESRPSADENFFLKYNHPYSFEAESWAKSKKKSTEAVCIMNAGYSSGWCQESFGIPLTAVEISCKAKGDDSCTFIMAPPHKIEKYLGKEKRIRKNQKMAIPTFLERKKIEEELQISLQEKELLLKEVHHRVKNNLQVIASLLNLQSKTFVEKEFKAAFKESINRINSMAVIHELLYSTGNLTNVKTRDFINSLVRYISDSYPIETEIKFEVIIADPNRIIDMDKGIPCGLIINELLSNCFKYAFKGKRKGKIRVTLSETKLNGKGGCELIVEDNGIGFPKDVDIKNPISFGWQIINSLVMQLNGSINMESKNGTKFTIRY